MSETLSETLIEAAVPAAARMTNVALTAQVQLAYSCAGAAASQAERNADCIENSWPDTPLRALVVQAYRAQAQQGRGMQREILRQARRQCGLAFARFA